MTLKVMIVKNKKNNVNNSFFYLCVSVLCSFVLEWACSIFGVSVFNVFEVGFDSPTKLVSGDPLVYW